MHRIGLLIGTALLLTGTSAVAENLVSNGSFNTSVAGWQSSHGYLGVTWTDIDATGSPGSGSALGTNGAPGMFDAWFYQCVPSGIVAGSLYDFGARMKVPNWGVSGVSSLGVNWMSGAGCTGGVAGTSTVSSSELDTWVTLSKPNVTAPAGTVSAVIYCRVYKHGSGSTYQTFFDDVYLSSHGLAESTQTLFLPAAAAKHGVGTTYWSTNGWFANLTDATVTVRGAFLRAGTDNSAAVASPVNLGTVPPGGFGEFADIVTDLGAVEATGGVYLLASASGAGLPGELILGTSYTFTPNELGPGNYGQGIPAVPAGTDADVMVSGVFQSSTRRTNVGALNTSSVTVAIEVTVRNAYGFQLGQTTWTLPPYAHTQVSVEALGGSATDGGSVQFRRTSAGGSFRAYTSTVDQQTGDAIYNPAR